MFVRVLKSAVLAVALFGLSTTASAATIFNFNFSAPWSFLQGGGAATGNGQLFADANSDGTFSVTGVSATSKVTASSSNVTLNAVSAALLSTATITGDAINGYAFSGILSGGSTSYNFSKNLLDANYTISTGFRTTSGATFTLAAAAPTAAVPETATWMMMIVGFAGIGIMLRAAKRRDMMQIAAR
jgi:hypothetical protein